jgi:hypothetical protein
VLASPPLPRVQGPAGRTRSLSPWPGRHGPRAAADRALLAAAACHLPRSNAVRPSRETNARSRSSRSRRPGRGDRPASRLLDPLALLANPGGVDRRALWQRDDRHQRHGLAAVAVDLDSPRRAVCGAGRSGPGAASSGCVSGSGVVWSSGAPRLSCQTPRSWGRTPTWLGLVGEGWGWSYGSQGFGG